MRLSPAELMELRKVCQAPKSKPHDCNSMWIPALRLIEAGLASSKVCGFYRITLTATAAGHQFYQAHLEACAA